MTKVLHIFGIMNRGGAELRTISLMPYLKHHDIEFDFVALSGQRGVLDESLEQQGSKVHYIRLGLSMILPLYRLFKSGEYRVVHSHVSLVSGLVLLIARIAGVSIRIAHFRNTTDVEHESFSRRLRNRVLKSLILTNATKVFGVCQGALDGYWSPTQQQQDRFKVIYNGFELPTVMSTDTFWRDRLNQDLQSPIMINVARMDYQKNHVRQVKIFAEYVALYGVGTMVFVGKEVETVKAEMVDLANQLKIAERLVFMSEQSDVISLLTNADIMLFPSKWEGLPGAVIEAASVGMPVLGSDIPGIREISTQLNHVLPYSLEHSDKQWAEKLHECLTRTDTKQQRIHNFEGSVFQISANVESIRSAYTE